MLALGAGIVLAVPSPRAARAQAPEPDPDPLAVQLHGFVSQGYLRTTANNYLADSERGSFEFAEAGINLTKAMSERLRLGVQLFARDLGPLGDYSATFDWFYLDYRLADWLGLRAGRVKLPFGLYNEIDDIDAARVPVLLPQSVYATRNRDFLLAQTGVEIYGYLPLGRLGALDYRLFLGTIFLEQAPASTLTITKSSIPYVAGGRLLWDAPLAGLRLGGSVQALRLDLEIPGAPPTPPAMATIDPVRIPVVMWVASAEYVAEELLLAAEYGRWHLDIESRSPAVMSRERTQERFYVMGSYRVAPWLTPGLYVSALYPDVTNRSGRANYQHDVAATLRFDLTPNWLFKLEGHFMNGTAELTRSQNGNLPLSMLEDVWLLFLAKTTVYF